MAAFVNRNAIGEYLDSQSGPLPPILAAMVRLRKESPSAELVRELEAVPLKSADPDLAMLFLIFWGRMAMRQDRLEEYRAILARAEALVSERTPPELLAILRVAEGVLLGLKGDKAARERCYNQAVTMLPADSGRRQITVWDRARFLGQLGRAQEVEADLVWLAGLGTVGAGQAVMIRFYNCLETGQLEECDSLLPCFPAAALVEDPDFPRWRLALEVLRGRWQLPAEKQISDNEMAVRSTQLLMARDPAGALDWARRAMDVDPEHHLHLGFLSYGMIRAELSAGNGAAAGRLLGERHRQGFVHYLDDLFLARAEMLAGRREAAARHFVTATAVCEHQGASPRLDLELKLACELSPASLLYLGRALAAPPVAAPSEPPTPAAPGAGRLLGSSRVMEGVRTAVGQMAVLDAPVLVTGETGTGKELISRALHDGSPRAAKPFIAVNCGAIAETLLESELFGHERGAFTGAERARRGIFEEAGQGTAFLDEIGDISPRLQVSLLRVVETGEIRPVGASRSRKIACRIIAATNADLPALAERGLFRKDLLFRLRRLEIHVPPLRERREDIVPLAGHFLGIDRADGQRPRMSAELKAEMQRRDWPGNVRELKNAVERMRLLNSDKLSYELEDLSSAPAGPARTESETGPCGTARPSLPPQAAGSGPDPIANRPADEVGRFLSGGRSALRRLERLRELFRCHRVLTRLEIMAIAGVSRHTATRDLKALSAEGLIAKIEPTRSPRTHYFRLREAAAGGSQEV